MTRGAMCCALRDPARGVKGACRRLAKPSMLGTCSREHEEMVRKYVAEQAAAYAELVKQCEEDSTGMLATSAEEVRTIIVSTLVEEATTDAQRRTLEIQERLLASLETSKNKRKALEADERFISVSSKRARLLGAEEAEEAEEWEEEQGGGGGGSGNEGDDFNPFDEDPDANLALNRERAEDALGALGVADRVEQFEAMAA